MGEDAAAKHAAAKATIDFLGGVAEEARAGGNVAKLESAERAIESEEQRKASSDSRAKGQKSTFFVGSLDAPRPVDGYPAATESAPHEAMLVVYSGSGKGWEYALGPKRTVVGRDPDVEVTLDDESVSRRHAAIIKSGDGYFLRDLGSKNGTYFRGVLRGAEQRLSDGDQFRIGKSDFVFRYRRLAG